VIPQYTDKARLEGENVTSIKREHLTLFRHARENDTEVLKLLSCGTRVGG